MTRTKTKPPKKIPPVSANGAAHEIMTLAEAADYLRLSEEEVLRLVREQGLPGRPVEPEWRFLKSAVQRWLSQPLISQKSEGIWGAVGSWKDDPYLDDLLKEIYRKRERSMTEES